MSRKPRQLFIVSVVFLAAMNLTFSAMAKEPDLKGPVEARVVRVIDGDTFVAEARIWPGQFITVAVRVRGIDAPEMRSRCDAERAAALRSRNALEAMIAGAPVTISNIGGGKYYGRVLADVADGSGEPVGPLMLRRSLARAYGGGKRRDYCG